MTHEDGLIHLRGMGLGKATMKVETNIIVQTSDYYIDYLETNETMEKFRGPLESIIGPDQWNLI